MIALLFALLYGAFMFIPNYRTQKILYIIEAFIILLLIMSFGNKLRIHLILVTIEMEMDIITSTLLGIVELGIIMRLIKIKNK